MIFHKLTSLDATPSLKDKSENDNNDDNVATESMHEQEQQAVKVTQPIQQVLGRNI